MVGYKYIYKPLKVIVKKNRKTNLLDIENTVLDIDEGESTFIQLPILISIQDNEMRTIICIGPLHKRQVFRYDVIERIRHSQKRC